MVVMSENDVPASETLNSQQDEIQSFVLQPSNDGNSVEQLLAKAQDVGKEEEAAEGGEVRGKECADEAIQRSGIQSMDDQDLGEKRKRENGEEETGEAKDGLHPLWKTSLCSYFRSHSGSCSHGDTCRYAHGEEELRRRPDNSWDPTSERAKKLLKSENGEKVETSVAREDVLMVTDAFADSKDPALDKCLVNIPQKWTSDDLRSFLVEQGIPFKSAKKKKGMKVGFVSFESTEQMKDAIEGLDGKSIGNKHVKVADVIARSFDKKTKSKISLSQGTQQSEETDFINKDPCVSISLNGCEVGDSDEDGMATDRLVIKARTARDVVTPFAHMPYSDQLLHKKDLLVKALKKLTRNARKACPAGVSLPDWILKSRDIGGLPCRLEDILESPVIYGYRNKCEFSIGYSLQGKPTVGFMLGNFREGVTAVHDPVDCPNVSRIACKYASILQQFLQNSGLPIWNRISNTGFWRQLTVREGRSSGETVKDENVEASSSEVMLVVQVCSVGFADELITMELQKMAHSLALGAAKDSPPLPLTALVLQDHKGISNAAPSDAPLRPLPIPHAESDILQDSTTNTVESRIHDYISGLRFCISPTAFFQVNTLAAEKLYSLAGDWADLGPDTLLFDICCGTGTIGLTLAHRVGMVVGIEMNASAVSDARRNAEINAIKNCRFVCAKAEDVLGSLLKEYQNTPCEKDEIRSISGSNDIKQSSTGDKGSFIDRIPHVEECSNQELGDLKCTYSSPNKGMEKSNEPVQSGIISKDNTTLQQFKNVVAIVDPPRVGLHPIVIKALRTHPRLRRLVYISCNPESLMANAIELCTPSAEKTEKTEKTKKNRGWRNMSCASLARHRAKSMPNSEPFHPVKAVAVDLFPHTPHCEMVMLLER